ncbi:hypothetical protein FN846DRAFT_332709 [Sphaerosporella brunnea]|uniref:Uncharacterized protein n=1 Tax=Sphaerosporella brunnea TaxID=1250544 RepID=A0A5J5EII5_9PEZI|nr:hypothetical protein FN846DRAFT_332709 [Sphaerosporella brunnea]
MSSLWINKKKKGELVALCDQLGLQTDGYLKSDLESLLSQYLQDNEKELSQDPTFAPYYDTLSSRSPSKRTTTSILTATDELPQTRTRRRTSRYVPGSTSFEDQASTDGDFTPEPQSERKTRGGSRALAVRTPRPVRSLRDAAGVALPPSPAAVADGIESRVNAIAASAKTALESAEIAEKALNIRDRLSNVISVNATSLSLEAVLLLVAVVPVSYELTLPAVDVLGWPATTYVLPDLFVLLTTAFWAPFLVWLSTALLVPLANAVTFNLVATTVQRKNEQYRVDPLTFAVTRALAAYLVHYKGFTFGGLFSEQAIKMVGASVGKELQIIGAGIGGIAALWVGILSRR